MDPAGERSDFSSVYEDHIWTVYAFFGYRVRSRPLAEDLTQTTFERALKAWDRYDASRASHQTWLLAIARNLLIDDSRRKQPAAPSSREPDEELESIGSSDGDPGASEVDLGLASDLQAAVESLGERERELIALRFGGDLNGPEIAELTGLTLSNVQQILSRALRRMRTTLAEHEGVASRQGP
ncbi:sigma-70 family RNA polymerase sigma factor [Thermoleophilia bacterium SCSIO 60948]|nr:sigma-70 family RNA polymerase sigma factor [Thermoleophilia bacterium SCSIO 60948]